MMPTVQGVETLCRPYLPVLFRTILIPKSILQLVMAVILRSNHVLRSNTGIRGHKNLGYVKTFSTLRSTVWQRLSYFYLNISAKIPKIFRKYTHFCHVYVSSTNKQGPKGGVPGALEPWNFRGGARSPIILLTGALILFWLCSPEPKDILRGAWSPAFSSLIIRVPRLHWFLITAFLCLFVRVNGHKETESEERTVHNTSIRGYLSL